MEQHHEDLEETVSMPVTPGDTLSITLKVPYRVTDYHYGFVSATATLAAMPNETAVDLLDRVQTLAEATLQESFARHMSNLSASEE